jgi:hypothetical protein
MVVNTTPSSTVSAKLTFFVPPADGSKPAVYAADRSRNYTDVQHEVVIENVRGKEDQYTLDNAGFQWLNAPARHKSFKTEEEIKNEYYPESIELLKKVTGASRAVIFDHSKFVGFVGSTLDSISSQLFAAVDPTKWVRLPTPGSLPPRSTVTRQPKAQFNASISICRPKKLQSS